MQRERVAERKKEMREAEKCRVTPLPEEELAERMSSEVEPYLEKLCRRGRFGAEEELAYELFALPGARATVVISHGFVEASVKFHELIYYLLQAGLGCAVMDHRGHGDSVREGDGPNVVHVDRFDRYVEDLHCFVETVVRPAVQGPLYLYGHSMGGCIAARYLEEYPEDFEKAVLNAPMLGIQMGGLPSFAAVLVCDLFILLGRGRKRLFFQGDFDPQAPFEKDCATSRARFEYYHKLRKENAALQTSAASYRWAKESVLAGRKACRLASRIQVPVLLFQAENDELVKAKPQEKFVRTLPKSQLVRISGSKHEIYRSGNETLEKYLGILLDFFSGAD